MTKTNGVHSITPDLLKALVPTLSRAKRDQYAPLINAACVEFDITNEARVAAFLSQLAHESDRFNTFAEYASGAAYDGRRDLGNTRAEAVEAARRHNTTPGRFYKGHGAIQTTGYSNHKAVGEYLGIDAVNEPGLLATPQYAFRAAGYFWHVNKLNRLADRREIRGVSGVVNAGSATAKRINGLAERVAYYERALAALPDDFRLTADAPTPDPHAEPDVTAEAAHAGELAVEHAAVVTGDQTQAVPVVAADAKPVLVEATAVTKSGSRKSLVATITAAAGTLGVGVETVYGKVSELIKSGNPTVALVVVAILAAVVVIYWRYTERQTRLDALRETHAHETDKLKMTIAADQTKNNVELVPNAVPVEADDGALTPSGARD